MSLSHTVAVSACSLSGVGFNWHRAHPNKTERCDTNTHFSMKPMPRAVMVEWRQIAEGVTPLYWMRHFSSTTGLLSLKPNWSQPSKTLHKQMGKSDSGLTEGFRGMASGPGQFHQAYLSVNNSNREREIPQHWRCMGK